MMIARTVLALPSVVLSLVLCTAPVFAGTVMHPKDRVAQPQQRRVHHVRWDRYLHSKITHGGGGAMAAMSTSDDMGASERGEVATPLDRQAIESGIASWYGLRHQGRITSSGRPFNQNELTAAHRWLPMGSHIRVRLVGTSRSVDVTITDRPGTRRRIIDLSREAARQLGMVYRGTALVSLSRL